MSPGARSPTWRDLTADTFRVLRSQWHDAERLHHAQHGQLAEQIAHAVTSVPFYRSAWPSSLREDPGHWPALWPTLPLVRRDAIQADPEAFLSEHGDRAAWRTSRTSGSTGRPLVSFHDPRAWWQGKVLFKLRRLLASGWRPGHRIVVVEALPAHELERHADAATPTAARRLEPRRFLSIFDPPEAHLPALLAHRPHFIYALPSYLAALLQEWGERERRRIPLRALMTSGEWLPRDLRARLERGFGVPLLDVYGSTEFKEIAWQCRHRTGYHVNMESVRVDILDETGQAVQPGESGEIVVTSLINRAMPLLRYATGDRALELPGTCACGRRSIRLDAFEGRTVDVLSLPGGRSLSPYALTMAVEAYPGLLQYRFVQRGPDRLEMSVVLNGSPDEASAALRAAVSDVVGPDVRVDVHPVASLPREPSGKCSPVHSLTRTPPVSR